MPSGISLTTRSVAQLYTVLHDDLRGTLTQAEAYRRWSRGRAAPANDAEQETVFTGWLAAQAAQAHAAARGQLRPRPLAVFRKACERRVFGPGDYAAFGFASIQALRPHLRDLEAAGLLASSYDDGDGRRKIVRVTDRGWLVKHHLDRRG